MKHIAILAGGVTSERVISVKTAQELSNSLDKKRYTPYIVDVNENTWEVEIDNTIYQVNRDDFSIKTTASNIHFDFALIAIHGRLGEDGLLQAYFEMLGIPYSGCNVLTSALCFDKNMCKDFLQNKQIDMANSEMITPDTEYNINNIEKILGMPLFVKPNTAGSSFGITRVNRKEELEDAIKKAFTEDKQVIVESFIEGTEVSCGVFKSKKKAYVFPITEIDTKNEFFDFEAKYTPGITNEITPARISTELSQKVQTLSSSIYDMLQCKGIVRIDYIIKNNIPYFLEVNTVPGMSTESIIPQQIRAAGYTLSDILNEVIEDCSQG